MKELIAYITSRLTDLYPEDEARAMAWWIVEESTGLSRNELLTGCKVTKNIPNLQEILNRLHHFEPIQYIFGHTQWMGLDLLVTPATLIPRPETAELVERIVNQSSNRQFRVLDVGTGSGCIAIALKKRHPDWQVTGIDISAEAVEVARQNAVRNGVEVDFQVADIFDFNEKTLNSQPSILNAFNLVVSNPPYICEKEKKDMRPNVLDYEPHTALFVPDNDPLRFYRRIASLCRPQSPAYDIQSPFSNSPSTFFLFFEINEAYSGELSAMLAEMGYTDIRITNDIYGKPRIIQARSAR